MSLPTELGPCDDLVVDLTSSSGAGGRLWKSVSFLVGGPSPNISSMQAFLSAISSNPSSVRSPVVIPNSLLTSGFAYSLEVRLCNFLGACGLGVKRFVVSSSKNVPMVLLHSGAGISIFRNSSLTLSCDAYISACGGGESRGELLFSWVLSETNVLLSSPIMQSVSVNPREFKLPSYRLRVGSLYNLTLTVKHTRWMKSSSVSLNVLIKSGDLVCILTGGDELGLRIDGSLLLDMSKSYDSNIDPSSRSQPLSFKIRCFQISPLYQDSCLSLVFSSPPLASSSSQVLVTTNSSAAVVGDAFQIMISGTSPESTGDLRSCVIAARISILAALSPLVKFEVISGPKMNPSSKLKLLGRVDMESSGEVQWSVNDHSIVLSSISLSPLSRSLPASPINSSHVLSLVIVGNSLPQLSSFIFTLSCSLVNGYSSSNSITISTNSPPFGGALEVSPVKGVMFQTLFSMLGLGWVDDNLPLSYQFGYFSAFPTTSSTLFLLRTKLQVSHTSSLLPSGSQRLPHESSSNLTCVVIVFDQLDSPSNATFTVQVDEKELFVDDLRLFMLTGINLSHWNSNPDDLKSSLSLTTTILNRVNCSIAFDCFALNRMTCSTTEGTCGECLDGFLGLLGSSNTPCASPDDVRRHLESFSSTAASTLCNSHGDCDAFGLFLECNFQSHLCQSIQQTCPNSCSGHGSCVFSSKYNLNETMDECALLDTSCAPRCECGAGFMGSSCSLSEVEFVKQVDLRHLMIESVRDLMTMENVEANNVKFWMQILSSVSSSDYLALSEDSKILMSSLGIDILRASAALGLSIEDLKESGMDKVLAMGVSGLSLSLTAMEGDPAGGHRFSLLMSLLSESSNFMISDMLNDQYPVSSVTSYLRSSSFFLASSPTSLSLPQTDLESLTDLRQHSISLPSNITLPLQITISETLVVTSSVSPSSLSSNTSRRLNPDANDTAIQLSLPLFVSLASSASCSSEGDCVMKVMLQHKPRRKASNALTDPNDSPYFEADYVPGIFASHEFLCPSGEKLVITCNGSVSGRGRRYCPMRSQVTLCDTSSTEIDSEALSCLYSPLESNESVTTCLCNLSTLSRSMTNSPGSVSFTILSIEKSLVTEFVSTWESVSLLSTSDVLASWDVLVTTTSFVGVFSCFIVWGIYLDLREKRRLRSPSNSFKTHSSRKSSFSIGRDIPKKRNTSPRFVGVPSSIARSQRSGRLSETINFIEESLPSIFKSDSLWLKFKEEMRVYHRWLGIVFYYSPEFPRAMRVLEWVVSGWLFVFLMNFGMLFYVYLFAMTQAPSRQSAWFQSFVIWLIFEIFISSTGLVIVMQLLIPLYVFTEMSEIKTKVLKDLMTFRANYFSMPNSSASHRRRGSPVGDGKSSSREESQQHPQFNAARYLFTSWRVAALCPDLPESELILQFSTPWPKKKFGSREAEVSSYYDQTVLLNALSRIMIYFLTTLLRFHRLLQDIVVQMFCDSGMGYLGLLMIRLYRVHHLLLLAVVFVLLLCLHFLITSSFSFSTAQQNKKRDPYAFPIKDPNEEESTQQSCASHSSSPSPVGLRTIYDFFFNSEEQKQSQQKDSTEEASSLDHKSHERKRHEMQMEAAPPTAAAVTVAVVDPAAAVVDLPSLSVEAADCSMDEEIEWEDSDSDLLNLSLILLFVIALVFLFIRCFE
jgi:hypothetical protein